MMLTFFDLFPSQHERLRLPTRNEAMTLSGTAPRSSTAETVWQGYLNVFVNKLQFLLKSRVPGCDVFQRSLSQ